MSLIDSLPRVRSLRLPRADGLIPWIVPLVIILIWQVACVTGFVSARVLPAPSDVALAGWKLLLSGDCAHWGSPPSRTSFVFDSMLRLSYFLGNYYPQGGSQAFVDDLARQFEELGGDILMHSTVDRIVVEDGAATGVEIDTPAGGRTHRVRVRAGYVISNADLVLTMEKLLGPGVIGDEAMRAVKRLRPTYPCFLTHIGLRDIPVEPLSHAAGYHWRSWDPDRVMTDTFKIFVPTMYEPALGPAGGQIVILQRVMDVEYDAITDWTAHKKAVEADLMARFEAAVPGISAHIVTVQSASAFTSWRYTLNYQGAMLGWEMSPDQLGPARPAIDGASPVAAYPSDASFALGAIRMLSPMVVVQMSQSSRFALLIVAARTPMRSAASIWLRMRASSGDTNNVGPAPRSRSMRVAMK